MINYLKKIITKGNVCIRLHINKNMLSFDSFLGSHYLGEEEEEEVRKVIRSKSLFRYDGPNLLKMTEKFENNLKEFFGVKYAIACSSGAAALKMCCVALGIGYGDEVIIPAFTFIASASAVLNCGALPVFVDVDQSMNIDCNKIENVITERTKAIMAVHIQGVPCDMDKILDIAQKHNLYVIEDAAQAFGSMVNSQKVGTLGDVAAFSLQANKVITAGEGGIFLCKSEEQYLRAKMYHDNGGVRVEGEYPTWEKANCSFGENYKISELSSAVANAQLKKYDMIYEKQERLYNLFVNNLNMKKFTLRNISECKKIFPVSLCLIFSDRYKNEAFIEYANSKGIKIGKYCDKVLTNFNTFKYQKGWHKSGFPYNVVEYHMNECDYTKSLVDRTAWLPISPLLEKEDVEYICQIFNGFNCN